MPTGPRGKELVNENNFFDYVTAGQRYGIQGGVKSTAAINGVQRYGASTHSVSDILQGNLYQTHPEDQLLILNKALTEQLGLLAESGENILGFSSFTSTVPTLSGVIGSGRSGSGSGGSQGEGSILNEAWVRSLPGTHANGAFIWSQSGKASFEMHLPTSGNLEEDVAQHIQDKSMPDWWQHPFNMDRVGGAVGGESGSIQDVNQGPTRMRGENPDDPGQTGAWGYLTPQDEQYYISMAWPFKGVESDFIKAGRQDLVKRMESISKNDYKGRRVLVYSMDTHKGVVCAPGEWGSRPYWSNGALPHGTGDGKWGIRDFYFGLAPDVHWGLGTNHGSQMLVGFMPDNTPLGPYMAANSNEGGVASYLGVTGSQLTNTIEELKYAGEIIANHPNNQATNSGFREILTRGFVPSDKSSVTGRFIGRPENIIPTYVPSLNRGFLLPSLLNYLYYILEHGFVIGGTAGTYVPKYIQKDGRESDSISNHSIGGAIDIMRIGYNAPPVPYTDDRWRSYNDQLFNYLATLPRDTKPWGSGSSFAFFYSGWYNVYKDGNPTHIHFGFSPNQVGRLVDVLLPPGSRPSSGGVPPNVNYSPSLAALNASYDTSANPNYIPGKNR